MKNKLPTLTKTFVNLQQQQSSKKIDKIKIKNTYVGIKKKEEVMMLKKKKKENKRRRKRRKITEEEKNKISRPTSLP